MGGPARRVVLGLGNTLNTDEGLGVHSMMLLKKRLEGRTDVEFLDGGTLGLNLLPIVEECSHLLLLDAVNAGKPAGTVVEIRGGDIPLFTGIKLSEHQLTFQEVLGLAHVRERFPGQLHLVGVQPADLSIGIGLSDTVSRSIPDLLGRAEAVLQAWGLIPNEKGR
jgi:hydrogenase maturation protease